VEGDDELGPCTRCDHGWVSVGAGYVTDHAKLPDHVVVSEADREVVLRAREVALGESVYPCRVCRPRQFFRWVKGCGEPGHDAENCDLCRREAERSSKATTRGRR
jgi:hypothetical protein